MKTDPKLDLVLERTVDVSPELVWMAWTEPEHLKKWFAPAPWKAIDCEVDLRPGGLFRTVMQSPDGKEYPGAGCYLEIIPNKKLVWTDALVAGFRPAPGDSPTGFRFTATILIEPNGKGAKYTAIAMHSDEEGRKKHDAMGFIDGWGQCLQQLVEYVKTVRR